MSVTFAINVKCNAMQCNIFSRPLMQPLLTSPQENIYKHPPNSNKQLKKKNVSKLYTANPHSNNKQQFYILKNITQNLTQQGGSGAFS